MPQITRAYNQNGTIRFDALAEIRTKHIKELYELSWSNVYDRPDLQLKVLVLKVQDNYKEFVKYAEPNHALAFADAAYNGGIGGLNTERRACKMSSNCDPQKWFGNVELYCMKSKAPLYGNRSACDINRDHVRDVLLVRSNKYEVFFKR